MNKIIIKGRLTRDPELKTGANGNEYCKFTVAVDRRKIKDKDREADFVEKNFEASIQELKWHLIKEQIVAAQQIEVKEEDLMAVAKSAIRAQFAQYGMNNIPEDVVENYASEQLKKRENIDNFVDRAVDMKLTEVLKTVVKLEEKPVSLEEFNKLMERK